MWMILKIIDDHVVLANVDDIEDLAVLAKSFSQEYCEQQHEEEANADNINDLTTSCKISNAPIIDNGVDEIDHH